jgi:hypothetical protein
MRFVAAALAMLALAFLSGCAQMAIPSACQSLPDAKMANCIYINSVAEQNPYYCYSLLNLSQRKTCLQDSTDTAMRDALQRAPQEQRDAIFTQLPPPQKQPAQKAPAVQQPPIPAQASGCNSTNSSQAGSCLRALALSQLNVTACDSISDSVQRNGCISGVARMAKNVSACASLNGTEEASICSYYAKGE